MAPGALPLTVSVHANQLDAVEEVCSGALGCAHADVLSQLALLILFGLVTVFVLAAVQHISQARHRVTEERSRTATEQQAFARFAREVARIEPSRSTYQLAPGDGVVSTVSVASGPTTDQGLEAVREAYEGSVMTMAHYEEEYDEPLAQHMGQEFGEEVAAVLLDGDQLTPDLKQVLIERAREASRDRERLMTRLNRETEALDEATDELTSVSDTVDEALTRPLDDLTFPQLTDEWNRLGELEARLSRLLARRQESLHASAVTGPRARHPSLNEYLYGSLDTSYPILTDGAALVDHVKAARTRVLSVLTTRA